MIHDGLKELRDKHRFFPQNILDIGAFIGNFTRMSKTIWPISKSVMIEGNEECRYQLSTIGDTFYITLLGDEDDKKVNYYKSKIYPMCTGNSIYKENSNYYSNENVIVQNRKIIKLDTLLKDKNIKFDFAKLDTQGSELDIIRGGIETISTCKYILMEVSLKYYNEGIPLKEEVLDFMNSIGYNKHKVVEEHIWENTEKVADIVIGDNYQEDIIFFKE